MDFYLHMTQHCVIGDSTIFMVFQLDSQIEQPDNVLVVSTMQVYMHKSEQSIGVNPTIQFAN